MATTPGGHGRGAMRGNVGGFLLTNVELLGMPQYKPHLGRRKNTCKPKPRSVEELMTRIGLEVTGCCSNFLVFCSRHCMP